MRNSFPTWKYKKVAEHSGLAHFETIHGLPRKNFLIDHFTPASRMQENSGNAFVIFPCLRTLLQYCTGTGATRFACSRMTRLSSRNLPHVELDRTFVVARLARWTSCTVGEGIFRPESTCLLSAPVACLRQLAVIF